MKILIKNATLISMDENREKIERNTDILIEEENIKDIGNDLQYDADKVIDATNNVILPGLINTHSHVPMSIFRETLDGYNLQDWLNKKIWPMEAKLTRKDIYYASYLSFIEMIENGCTTINDMYFLTEDIIKAMQETGIRLQTTRCLMNMAGDEDGNTRLIELQNLIDEYQSKDNRLTFNVGIHGLYTSNEQYVKKCIEFAKRNELPVHIHFCENSEEVEQIKSSYNATPIEVLKRDFNDVHTILAHSVKLSNEEIKQISDMNIAISHCPVSNLKLGCGVAKINEMVNDGINVSIGTDGQGSGSNLDLFEAMKYAALLQKGITENPEAIPSYEALKMATINGAKALGLEEKIGTITKNKKADLIILELNGAITKPENDLISEIVYNVKGSNVLTTIVNGNILMENKKLNKNINKNEIFNKCEEIIERIVTV